MKARLRTRCGCEREVDVPNLRSPIVMPIVFPPRVITGWSTEGTLQPRLTIQQRKFEFEGRYENEIPIFEEQEP